MTADMSCKGHPIHRLWCLFLHPGLMGVYGVQLLHPQALTEVHQGAGCLQVQSRMLRQVMTPITGGDEWQGHDYYSWVAALTALHHFSPFQTTEVALCGSNSMEATILAKKPVKELQQLLIVQHREGDIDVLSLVNNYL